MVEDNKQKECLKISTTTFRNIMNELVDDLFMEINKLREKLKERKIGEKRN